MSLDKVLDVRKFYLRHLCVELSSIVDWSCYPLAFIFTNGNCIIEFFVIL